MKISFLIAVGVISSLLSCTEKPKEPFVTNYAGNGSMGFMNGERLTASFSNLMGIASDGTGNLFIADSRNNMIRKISPAGIVTTLAGSGKVGSADGKGTSASFFYPTALATDKNGNVFVADTHNNLIRKVRPDGSVETFAGMGGLIFDNPEGIAVDSSGNVFVSDWNDRIRKINPEGKVTNFAGSGQRGPSNGVGSMASFYIPRGMVVDKSGNLFVSDSYNNQIRRIDPAGQVTSFAGRISKGSTNGRRDSATFFHPHGIAIDGAGNIFVADTGNNLIRKISTDGIVTTLAGTGTRGFVNGGTTAASFWRPMGVAVDRAGNVYVADYQNNLVRKISY